MKLDGVIVIEPTVFVDNRGWFYESYNKEKLKEKGIDVEFIQDNHSLSGPVHTLRGIHFQNAPYAQSKLVRCIRGRIMDYAVDLRKNSSTYLKWICVELSADNKKQLFIPQGFGHAFVTLESDSEVNYKVDVPYSKTSERTICFNDEMIGIDWPKDMMPIMSEKDMAAPTLANCDFHF